MRIAARRAIPAGCRRDFVPGVPRDVVDLRRERDAARQRDPVCPEVERLNAEIQTRLRADRQERWREHVAKSDRRTDPRRHWGLLRGLSGKWAHVPPNQPISFNEKPRYTTDQCPPSPRPLLRSFLG